MIREIDNENDDERQKRKPKIKKEKVKKHLLDDEKIRSHNAKIEIKKLKEDYDNEEWEDWDRYYNH
jgi:hypothetical protein